MYNVSDGIFKMSVVGLCSICKTEIKSDEHVCTLGEQAALTVKKSSSLRNSDVSVSVGKKLHEKCRKRFTVKKSIETYRKNLNV